MSGFLLIDPDELGPEFKAEMESLVFERKGWKHPDGRWVVEVDSPRAKREMLILKNKWPESAVRLAE